MNFDDYLKAQKETEGKEELLESPESTQKKILKVQDLLRIQFDKGASDLHIAVGVPPLLRINGKLEKMEGFSEIKPEDSRRLISSLLSDVQREEYNLNHQLDFAYELVGLARFRVNAYWERRGESAAFRLIPTEIKTVKELGLPEILNSLAYRTRGFVVVTGPTGSGKSTTLAAMVDLVNSDRHDHIITIEDPIEFIHQHRKKNRLPEFDSVRGVFFEGKELYPNAGFKEKNHIQIAIRNLNCIKGYFMPREIDNKYRRP